MLQCILYDPCDITASLLMMLAVQDKHHVTRCNNHDSLLDTVAISKFDLLLYHDDGNDDAAFDIISRIKSMQRSPYIIYCSTSFAKNGQALRQGFPADDIIRKPFDRITLQSRLQLLQEHA